MEVVAKRILLLSGLLVAFGAIAALQPKTLAPLRTEKWMEEHLPMALGTFNMIPSAENPMCSYKMAESTYKELKPYGIVARIFSGADGRFDTVVVAANDRVSLHEPTTCFPGQDWVIKSQRKVVLKTKTRGDVNTMLLDLDGPNGKRIALYTFRGPSGTFAVRDQMYWDWFVTELKGSKPEGALMRVMTSDPITSEEELVKFSTDWFDATYKDSSGIY